MRDAPARSTLVLVLLCVLNGGCSGSDGGDGGAGGGRATTSSSSTSTSESTSIATSTSTAASSGSAGIACAACVEAACGAAFQACADDPKCTDILTCVGTSGCITAASTKEQLIDCANTCADAAMLTKAEKLAVSKEIGDLAGCIPSCATDCAQ